MTSASIKPKSHSYQPIPSPFVLRDESVDGRYLPSNANWNVASSSWLCFFVSYARSPLDMMEPCLLFELKLQGWSLPMSFSNGDPQWGLSMLASSMGYISPNLSSLKRIKDLHNVANHTLSTDSTSHEPRAMPHDLLQDSLNRRQYVCMTSASIKPKSHSYQPIPSPLSFGMRV